MIIGARIYDAGSTDEGAAFVFLGSAAGADTQLESNQAGAELGQSVAGAGDVNGDAACDVEDLAILQRIVNAQPASVANACQAYLVP